MAFRLLVPLEGDGQRLDQFLKASDPHLSRSHFANLVRDGRVTLNGQPVRKAGQKLKHGDLLEVKDAAEESVDAKAEDASACTLDIRYQDEALAVLYKPPGLVVHPGAGHKDGTLLDVLSQYTAKEGIKCSFEEGERPFIVHRLDQATGGLLVVAFHSRSMKALQAQFKVHQVERVYHAVVFGSSLPESGTIDTPYGRHPKDRKRFTGRLEDSPRRAITHFEVEEVGELLSLVKLQLETGRTHQIRVHLSEKQHPILNDAKYGWELRYPQGIRDMEKAQYEFAHAKALPRLALEATTIGFKHPLTGDWLHFENPKPPEFLALFKPK